MPPGRAWPPRRPCRPAAGCRRAHQHARLREQRGFSRRAPMKFARVNLPRDLEDLSITFQASPALAVCRALRQFGAEPRLGRFLHRHDAGPQAAAGRVGSSSCSGCEESLWLPGVLGADRHPLSSPRPRASRRWRSRTAAPVAAVLQVRHRVQALCRARMALVNTSSPSDDPFADHFSSSASRPACRSVERNIDTSTCSAGR